MSKWPMNEAMAAEDRERKRLEHELRQAEEKALHEQRLASDPEYARQCQERHQALQALVQALEAGYQVPALPQGQTLAVESLEATMKLVTFDTTRVKVRQLPPGSILPTEADCTAPLTDWGKRWANVYTTQIKAAAGYCGFCGQGLHMCSCIDSIDVDTIEVTPVLSSCPPPVQAPLPLPPLAKVELSRAELAEQRVQRPTKPVTSDSKCYLCGLDTRQAKLVQSKSTGFFVCGGCALQHLGE